LKNHRRFFLRSLGGGHVLAFGVVDGLVEGGTVSEHEQHFYDLIRHQKKKKRKKKKEKAGGAMIKNKS
jgi:hypothetical protein